jgi:hypothetical protein
MPRRWYLPLSSYKQIHLPLREGTYNFNSSALFSFKSCISFSRSGKGLSIFTAEIDSGLDECHVSDSLNTLQRYNTSIFAFCGTVRLFTRMIEHHIYNHMRVADISSSPLTPKHRNNQHRSIEPKMLVGLFPVCCGTEALLLSFHGIDHYCTTAHFFMSSNANLGALISDNTTNSWNRRNHSILETTAFHYRLRASGPLCIEIKMPGDAIVDDVALTVFACRADRMHGIQFLGRAAALLHHHRPPLQCRIAVRGDVFERACISIGWG